MSSWSWNEYLDLFVDILRGAFETELLSIGVEPEIFKEIENPTKL